ncbi:MAG: NAD(P)-binding domain-containing protein [Desulfuromusa sp.]|jgi:pyrroline-5-carboxylate reductase|nr:NAD(P)-binding domain-containing protein [Desulfuromusa sp.]
MKTVPSIGIVGGTGQLGSAIALGLLRNKYFRPEQLWISSRSSNTSLFKKGLRIKFTTHNQDLVDSCQIVIISVPPHLLPAIDINAEDRLVISVMAGVSIKQLQQNTNTKRIVRAMSNPAAIIGLAYSPWCASSDLVDKDREWTQKIFEACGLTDEVSDENQIDQFTAITGPVPGFVAYYADCMVKYALKHGIDPLIADRAIRQLFHASGVFLSQSKASPGEHVNDMISYAGTTAAGLEAMKSSSLAVSIEHGLEAAYQKAHNKTR